MSLQDVRLGRPTSDVVDQLYDSLKNLVVDQDIDGAMISQLALNLMQVVEQMKNIEGKDKKILVLHVLRKFVTDTIKDGARRAPLLQVIDLAMPSIIDMFVALDRKDVGVTLEKINGGCLSCFGCK